MADESIRNGPSPAPKVELMEALGLRIRVSFPDFLAVPVGEAGQAPVQKHP